MVFAYATVVYPMGPICYKPVTSSRHVVCIIITVGHVITHSCIVTTSPLRTKTDLLHLARIREEKDCKPMKATSASWAAAN